MNVDLLVYQFGSPLATAVLHSVPFCSVDTTLSFIIRQKRFEAKVILVTLQVEPHLHPSLP